MIHISVAARLTCDCSNDGRTDVCGADVVGYGWTDGDARTAVKLEAYHAGWVLIHRAHGTIVSYARDHVIRTPDDSGWVRPVSLVKDYA